MKRATTLIRAFFISIFIILAVTTSGCGQSPTASWKEEVLLHDGSKIIVERWQKHGGRHEIGQRSPIREHSISFTLPRTKQVVTWKDEYSEDLGRSNFELVALHILNDAPYLITTPRLCLSYNKWGRPNPPYVVFKFENNKWNRINLSELPVVFKNINLVISTGGEEETLVSKKLVSTDMVKKMNSGLEQEEFKTIARTPLKGVGCPNWNSPNDSSFFKAPIPSKRKSTDMGKSN